MVSVESVKARKTLNRGPLHKVHAAKALLVIDCADPAAAVAKIAAVINETERARGCGTYLFIDPDTREVTTISETRACVHDWIKGRFGWLVGYYRTTEVLLHGRIEPLRPTQDGLLEDVRDHLGLAP